MLQHKNWMHTLVYAVLVLGTVAALALSERPLSSTVVTLALFSFNLAAILFIAPMVMEFFARMKDRNEELGGEVMIQLKEIKARLAILSSQQPAHTATPLAAPPVVGTPLRAVLSSTAQDLKHTSSTPPPPPAPPSSPTPQVFRPAPISMHQPASFDHLFGGRPAQVLRPAPLPTQAAAATPASTAHSQQIPLFSPTSTTVQPLLSAPHALAAQPAIPQAPRETTLIVTARVGDDDVLCLRGEGPGLNWQEGQPMNYIGNDQWRWSSAEVTQPVTCRIYRNDEFSAFGEDIVLSPGESMEVAPQFPTVEA